jgi:hypothetical protein
MDIPDLVRRTLGDEEIQAGVSIGDEDAAYLTPTRTLVYRGEGLLSDEQLEEYSHDVERVAVSEGRRKTKFTLQYIDGTDSFSVPANRGEKVLERFLEGVLRLDEVIDERESIVGVYRFSELTVIIAEGRLIKHIGEHVWDDDYEVYPYEDATELDFERASVATSITLTVDGRPQRIKVPNDKAPIVRQTLEKALFAYYDVGSLQELNRTAGDTAPDSAAAVESDDRGDGGSGGDDAFEFGDDFDPLVSDDDEELTESVDPDERLASGGANAGSANAGGTAESDDAPATEGRTAEGDASPSPEEAPADAGRADANAGGSADANAGGSADANAGGSAGRAGSDGETNTEATERPSGTDERTVDAGTDAASTPETETTAATSESGGAETGTRRTATDETGGETTVYHGSSGAQAAGGTAGGVSREEFEAVAERLDDLTEAVERQNELLRRQHRAIKQLVKQQSDE